MNFHTIPATYSFCDQLARYVDDLAATQNHPHSTIKIYLPTKRAIRTLKNAFLRQSNGAPRLLPQMMAIGDADDEELSFSALKFDQIPPAMNPMRRQVILARLLERAWHHDYDYGQAMALGAELGRLIDQIHTANITLDKLHTLIDIREFSEHWEMTVNFLTLVLGELWPNVLAEEGKIDPGLHRRLSIEQLTHYYRQQPSKHPVIVAGSTGSLPATRNFIATVADANNGHVIIPGLDTALEDTAWEKIETSHPQFHLKNLLSACKIKRNDVLIYPYSNNAHEHRLQTIAEIMRPASTTEQWQRLNDATQKTFIEDGLSHITQCACNNEDGEARTIALAMAEIAADPDQAKTCALITPDRLLAGRVKAQLLQWDITVDDSAGAPLPGTAIGRFALSLLQVVENKTLMPVPFLAVMKNKYAGGGVLSPHFRSELRQFEKHYLRGLRPTTDLAGLKSIGDKHHDFIDTLDNALAPLTNLIGQTHPLDTWMNAHISIMESVAATTDQSGADRLWIGHEGEAMAEFFEQLRGLSDVTPSLSHHGYITFIENLMATITTRPPFGTHPRLSILGQIESRMVQADRVILGGLNEGTWPPESGYDAFLSKPMRRDFGLPSLDQKTSLAAHDFATALGSPEVFITYSNRKDGSPCLPSRWIQRMETILHAASIDKNHWPISRGYQYSSWADELRHMNVIPQAMPRPRPAPALDRRPLQFSVTDIEKWMRDPYFIYAKRILNLRALDPVDMDVSARDKGNLIHSAFEQFNKAYPKQLPNNALDELIRIGRDVFDAEAYNAEMHGLWWPRFIKAAHWAIDYEQTWRTHTDHIYNEEESIMTVPAGGTDFTLNGKADRIEKRRGNEWAIIDYKTGSIPLPKEVNSGLASQLPIECLMLQSGAFANITPPSDAIYSLHYWSLGGGGDGGFAKPAGGERADHTQLTADAKNGLTALLACFNQADTPYIASPDPDRIIRPEYNDYAHLERMAEWSVIEGEVD